MSTQFIKNQPGPYCGGSEPEAMQPAAVILIRLVCSFPIGLFAHAWRYSVIHPIQSFTPHIYSPKT